MNITRYLHGFMDSEDFIIINNVPYYQKTDNTYVNVFRSGLSLDDILHFNTYIDINTQYQKLHKSINSNKSLPKIVKHIYYIPDINHIKITYSNKKQNKKNKKYRINYAGTYIKKIHKCKIRVSGKDWKQFMEEQEYGNEIVDLEQDNIKSIEKDYGEYYSEIRERN